MEPSPIAVEEARNGPPWIGETIALAREEVHRFLETALGFLRRPRAFSADWFAGRQRALNPIGFVASALAVSGAVGVLLRQQNEGGLWPTVELAMMPYLYYASVGRRMSPAGLVLIGLVLGVLHLARGFDVGVPHFVLAIRHGTPLPDIWF